MQFSLELRDGVLTGDITLSVRLWRRPKVRVGGRYPVGPAVIEVDSIELLPFAHISAADLRRSGEPDRETLRQRAAHAGPIGDDTLVYRITFHLADERRDQPAAARGSALPIRDVSRPGAEAPSSAQDS